ncbi:MAG TPA: 4'-phosphopantetheinyl transferase superfamily protein [Draconibacterium sp.]|nr:4'-phosphopantetheinyl transferase superfamily protein [Draconibacterium sp.]
MPFLKKIEVENGILGIWELTESVDSLISGFQFSENEKLEFKKFALKKRQSEYLATRLLLQNLLGEKAEIIYHESGRPQIKNSVKNISITHSKNLAAIFISDFLGGIDVEVADRNIDKVAGRFLNPKELSWIEQSKNPKLLKMLFWCAKEAIYKCACQPGLQFDTQIFIPPFDFTNSNFFKGKVILENMIKNYDLWFFELENNIAAYCVEVKNRIT